MTLLDTPGATESSSTTVRVARSTLDLEELRPAWDLAGPGNIDADLDHHIARVSAIPDASAYVLCLERPDQRPTLMVARLARESYPLRIGHRTLLSVTARTIVTSFDGVVGPIDEALADDVVRALRGELDRGTAVAVRFQQLPAEGELRTALERGCPGPLIVVGSPNVRRRLLLPESWEAWLAARSAKSRRSLRYDENLFRRTLLGRWQLRRWDANHQDEQTLRDLATVAGCSYQHGFGASSLDAGQAELLDEARRRNLLRAWVLYIDEKPVAFWWGVVYARTLAIGTPGYLPEHAEDRVGHFTMLRMIEDACADPAVDAIDFGHGDADYKVRFAPEVTATADVLLLAASSRTLPIRAVIWLDVQTTRLIRVVATTRLGGRLRRGNRLRALRRTAGTEKSPPAGAPS